MPAKSGRLRADTRYPLASPLALAFPLAGPLALPKLESMQLRDAFGHLGSPLYNHLGSIMGSPVK